MTKEEKYFSEVRMRLSQSGFSVLPVDDGCLPVLCDCEPLCRVSEKGTVFYSQSDCDAPEKMRQIDNVTRQAAVVREYMQNFDTAHAIKLPHLEGNYKLLADYNGTCLAARESEHGMQFVTWNWDYDRNGVNTGHYFSNSYEQAKDKYGSNILVDFDQRDEDKTSANILILGNSGQGKSYLMKLLMLNILMSGKSVISLDVEHEQVEMCEAVGGCFVDLMSGRYIINVLEPKCWSVGENEDDESTPETFRQKTLLSQHLSFLRDFFRAYKDFSDSQIDTIEILLSKLYSSYGISDYTDFKKLRPEDYPTLSDLYNLIESEYKNFNGDEHKLYTAQLLQEVLLGLNSICKGADSKFFNGHTNITSHRFLVFGVKSMLMAGKNVQNAMLFNILSFMSDMLLTEGNTVAALDELYIWLSNPTAIEYIRNSLKRVRKKESAILMVSQNLEDFDQEGVREMPKPLFSIPPHQFLFNAGSIDKRSYMDMLQLEESEYNLIRYPQRGVCLYKCGNERYLLEVHAPSYKEALFGKAGGR